MGNINQRINLAALISQVKEVDGRNGKVRAIIIPIEANHLWEGTSKDGKPIVSLDTIGFPLANATGKDTHLVKQSLPEEVRKKMTQEEQRAMPILGNMTDWDGGSASTTSSTAKAAKSAKTTTPKDDEPPF